MFSLLELKAPTDRLQSECDVRFICVKNEKLCKIRKRYYSKKRKENSNYGFLSVFFVLIVKNTQKMYFKIMKYIKL